MKAMMIILGSAATLLSGAAHAQAPKPPGTTTICLDVVGRQAPVSCRSQASRIAQREDICQCLHGGQQVTVAVCPEGVSPPAESAGYARERYAAVKNGSLVGATWRGRPICVKPYEALTGR